MAWTLLLNLESQIPRLLELEENQGNINLTPEKGRHLALIDRSKSTQAKLMILHPQNKTPTLRNSPYGLFTKPFDVGLLLYPRDPGWLGAWSLLSG